MTRKANDECEAAELVLSPGASMTFQVEVPTAIIKCSEVVVRLCMKVVQHHYICLKCK